MRHLLRTLAIGLAVIVASVTFPGSASATLPFEGQRLIWQNYELGTCLGVTDGRVDYKGQGIIEWTCNGALDQTWIAISAGGSDLLITNAKDTSKCLSVANKSMLNGARLIIWPCKPASDNQDQRWALGTYQPPCTSFLNYNSHRFMGVQGGVSMGNAIVQKGALSFANDMQWCSAPAPN